MKLKNTLPLLLFAGSTLLAAAAEKPVLTMDFESKNSNHVADDAFSGKQCFQFPGTVAPHYRKLVLPLKNNHCYQIKMMMRKGICSPAEAKKIDLRIGSYPPGGKKFRTYLHGGDKISGDGKWNEYVGKFVTPADGGKCSLMLYNRTKQMLHVDKIEVYELGKAADANKLITDDTQKIVRPVPAFTVEDAAKEDWLTNRRGIEALDEDFILPPFSPIDFKGTTAKVWGRSYTIGKYGLLDKVTILNENFLAGAMEFSATINGKKVIFKPENQTVLRQKKGVVELFSYATSKDVSVEIRTAIEYDGMIKVDFTIVPRGTVEVENFKYTIPYPEKYAEFIHYTGAREGYLSLNVPRISNTRKLPEGSGTVWEAPFKLLIWLGSYDRGLLWFCESEQYWSPHDRAKRQGGVKVIRNNGVVKLEIAPVTEKRLFSKRTTYTFGLMATPVRPRTPGWRAMDMNYEYYAKTAQNKYGANTPVIYSSFSFDHTAPKLTNPAAVHFYPRIYNPAAYKKRIDDAHKNNRLFGIYIDPVLCTLGVYKNIKFTYRSWDPTTDHADNPNQKFESNFLWEPPEKVKYFDEWRLEPLKTASYRGNGGERQFQVGLGSRYQDFLCYLLEKHAELGCDGIANLDEWGPVPDSNHRHDAGYYDRDGKRYPEYDWFARRDMLKRFCAVFYKKHGKLPLMRVHLAATLVIPIASFCDGVITGESCTSGYFSKPRLLDKYTVNAEKIKESLKNGGRDFMYYVSPPERWAIEYGGQAFGWNCSIMSNMTKSPQIDPEYASSEEAAREYLAMCLMHDNTLWPIFCNPTPAYKLMKIKQDFKIGDEWVKFYPYWGNQHPVKVTGKECYAVAWQNKDQYLAAVANLSLEDCSLTVSLDKKFFSGKVKIIDAETREVVNLHNNTFKVNIPRRNYKLYLIDTK